MEACICFENENPCKYNRVHVHKGVGVCLDTHGAFSFLLNDFPFFESMLLHSGRGRNMLACLEKEQMK